MKIVEYLSQGGFFRVNSKALEELFDHEESSNMLIRKMRIDAQDDIKLAIANAWSFPDFYGHNWDALVDCWSSLEGESFLTIMTGEIEDLPILESVVNVVADRYRQNHKAFAVLVSN